jgi:hypothetical protein
MEGQTYRAVSLARQPVRMTDDLPRVIREPISIGEVRDIAQRRFGGKVKACVDIASE